MAVTYCFTTTNLTENESYTAAFRASDGEAYVVTFKCSRRGCGYNEYGYGNIGVGGETLILEWKNKSSKFIKISLFNENNNQFRSDESLFVKDKASASFSFRNAKDSVIVVSVATRVHLAKCRPADPKPTNQILGTTEEKPITETKLEQLSTDIGSLLRTGNLSDVVLTDGTKEIRAHKLMLSARSSVFAKMFLHPMKENRENRITIQDISIEVLEELLHFMYSGTVVIKTSKMARDLYVAADKYDVRELRDICTAMLKSVDLNNVLDTLLLADLYSDKAIKESALHFISENYSQVKALGNWNSFMEENKTLTIEILSFVVDKKTTNL